MLSLRDLNNRYFTGWFGIPGGPASSSTKVHIIEIQDKPIKGNRSKIVCGSKVGPKQEFQWCSSGYGFNSDYLKNECQRCYLIASKFWIPWHEQSYNVRKVRIAQYRKQIKLLKKQIKSLTN